MADFIRSVNAFGNDSANSSAPHFSDAVAEYYGAADGSTVVQLGSLDGDANKKDL